MRLFLAALLLTTAVQAGWVVESHTETAAGYPSYAGGRYYANTLPPSADPSRKAVISKASLSWDEPWRVEFDASIIEPFRHAAQGFSRPSAFTFGDLTIVFATVIDCYYCGGWESVPSLIFKKGDGEWTYVNLFGEPWGEANQYRVLSSGGTVFKRNEGGWIILCDGYKANGKYANLVRIETKDEDLTIAHWYFVREDGEIKDLVPTKNRLLFPHAIIHNGEGLVFFTDNWVPHNIIEFWTKDGARFYWKSNTHFPSGTKGVFPYIDNGKLRGLAAIDSKHWSVVRVLYEE